MKKTGVLLFVIVLLFGCQKSKNVDFEKSIEELKQRNHLVFLPKNNNNGFDVFETLEGKLKSGVREFGVIYTFSDEELNENNQLLRKCFNFYLQHKFESYRDSTSKILLHSSKFFSMIEVLNSTAEDSTLTNEIQFSEIINQLDGIPYYFSQAKKIIKKPTKENLENAILQYSQDYFYLKNEFPLLLRKPDILKEDQINFSQKNQEAQLAVKDFIAFLNSQLFELGSNK
ncbi:MAG: hypothetical protein AB8H03_23665 [Saprospiraceae bacterium]